MIKAGHIRDVIFILIAIYFAQGSLYPNGSAISQIALAIIFAISSFYFFKTFILAIKKDIFYKAWALFMMVNVLGFVFTGSLSDSYSFGMFKNILMVSLPFYPFYYFAQTGNLRSKHLIRFFWVMIPITILQFYFNKEEILSTRVSGNMELVNNIAYTFAFLIPYSFLFKKSKLISIMVIMILLFFVLQGAKRGALITALIGTLFLIYYQLKTVGSRNRWKGYILVLLGTIALIYFTYDFYETNKFFIDRMNMIGEDGGSSSRDIIYANLFGSWFNSNSYFRILFGFGFAASLELSGTGNFAHNDWLELLSNYGLLGVVSYAFVFYAAIKRFRNSSWGNDKKLLLIAVVSMWFFTTLVSMNYTTLDSIFQTIMLAYLIGSTSRSIV